MIGSSGMKLVNEVLRGSKHVNDKFDMLCNPVGSGKHVKGRCHGNENEVRDDRFVNGSG